MTGREIIEGIVESLESGIVRSTGYAEGLENEARDEWARVAEMRRQLAELREILGPETPETVSLEFIVNGQSGTIEVAGDTPGADVWDAARLHAGATVYLGVEWEMLDANGFPVGVHADAATLALMPAPLYLQPRPGVGG